MNIVLLGFKSCGKSTLGKKLAYFANMNFEDTDTLVERFYLTTPECGVAAEAKSGTGPLQCREIYAIHGEEYLRNLEKKVVFALQGVDNTVIATGGGIVLDPANVAMLRATGLCVFIDTALALLEKRLSTLQTLLFRDQSIGETHALRYPLYQAAAHLVFSVSVDEPIEMVAEELYTTVHSQRE